MCVSSLPPDIKPDIWKLKKKKTKLPFLYLCVFREDETCLLKITEGFENKGSEHLDHI